MLICYEKILLENLKDRKKTKRYHNNDWAKETESIVYGGRIQVLEIYDFLYKDATIYLERKKNKFDSLKRRPETSSQKSLDDKNGIKLGSRNVPA